MSKQPQYTTKEGDSGPEIWLNDERIAFKNEDGKWNAAYGKGDQKADAVAWYEAQPKLESDEPKVTIEEGLKTEETADSKTFSAEEGHELVVDSEDIRNAQVEPRAVPVEPEVKATEDGSGIIQKNETVHSEDIGKTGLAGGKSEDLPPVPTEEPPQTGGYGTLTPLYLWWAWNQEDSLFAGIYGKSKSEWKKDHGGYLDQVVAKLQNPQAF